MLSRIKHDTDNDIAIIDTDDPFDPDALPDDDHVTDILPLIHDGLNLQTVANDQRKEFPELWQRGKEEDDEDYDILNWVLYSTKPPNLTAPSTPD